MISKYAKSNVSSTRHHCPTQFRKRSPQCPRNSSAILSTMYNNYSCALDRRRVASVRPQNKSIDIKHGPHSILYSILQSCLKAHVVAVHADCILVNGVPTPYLMPRGLFPPVKWQHSVTFLLTPSYSSPKRKICTTSGVQGSPLGPYELTGQITPEYFVPTKKKSAV